MIVSKFLMTGIPAAALIACTPFLHAAPQEEADIPSMTRTWTNKETGATFQARLAGLNSVNAIMQNVFTKKKIPFPLKKLSREDLDWIDFHKELVGKTDAELVKMVIPKGVLGKQLKGLTYREKDGKFVKMDGKWNARYFILYYSASWCGPCRASLPRNLEVYRDKIAPRKDLEVVLCSMDHALEGAQKWAVSNKMPWPVFLFGYLDNLSKESLLIRKNYPGPLPGAGGRQREQNRFRQHGWTGAEGGGAGQRGKGKGGNGRIRINESSPGGISRFFPHPDMKTQNSPGRLTSGAVC